METPVGSLTFTRPDSDSAAGSGMREEWLSQRSASVRGPSTAAKVRTPFSVLEYNQGNPPLYLTLRLSFPTGSVPGELRPCPRAAERSRPPPAALAFLEERGARPSGLAGESLPSLRGGAGRAPAACRGQATLGPYLWGAAGRSPAPRPARPGPWPPPRPAPAAPGSRRRGPRRSRRARRPPRPCPPPPPPPPP